MGLSLRDQLAEIAFWPLILVSTRAVDFKAGHWRGNCAGHFSVGWINGGQRLTCPELNVGIVLSWILFHSKLDDRWEVISFLSKIKSLGANSRKNNNMSQLLANHCSCLSEPSRNMRFFMLDKGKRLFYQTSMCFWAYSRRFKVILKNNLDRQLIWREQCTRLNLFNISKRLSGGIMHWQ
ncbi:hypothetical protein TNCV_2091241 [Trichonephila clavipes]|nr:hypothetical protein TNCV_2091241 [Trichonephila clavipes]